MKTLDKRDKEGKLVVFDALIAALKQWGFPAGLASDFMYMGTFEGEIHAFKHHDTRHYVHCNDSGTVFRYDPDPRFGSQFVLCEARPTIRRAMGR